MRDFHITFKRHVGISKYRVTEVSIGFGVDGLRLSHEYHDTQNYAYSPLFVPIGEVPGDAYLVNFTLQKVIQRDRVRWWRRNDYWQVAWSYPPGIPIRNYKSGKKDCIHASTERVTGPDHWRTEAVTALRVTILGNRDRYGYTHRLE